MAARWNSSRAPERPQAEPLHLSSSGQRAGSPGAAATRARSFNGPEPETDHRLASLPCLPVLVNYGFGVTSGEFVTDLCVILVRTFQFCA